ARKFHLVLRHKLEPQRQNHDRSDGKSETEHLPEHAVCIADWRGFMREPAVELDGLPAGQLEGRMPEPRGPGPDRRRVRHGTDPEQDVIGQSRSARDDGPIAEKVARSEPDGSVRYRAPMNPRAGKIDAVGAES